MTLGVFCALETTTTSAMKFHILATLFACLLVAPSFAQNTWHNNTLSNDETDGSDQEVVDFEPTLRPASGFEPLLWFIPENPGDGPAVQDFESNIPAGYIVAESQQCVEQLVAFDTFCVNFEWDDACQGQYDCCVGNNEYFNLSCNDASACNYDENSCLSTVAGTSAACLYDDDCADNCITLNLYDSFGDGWNGGEWAITNDPEGSVVLSGTMDDGFALSEGYCLASGCYELSITDGGTFPSEVFFELTGADNGSVTGNGVSTGLSFSVGNLGGCTVLGACNYDEMACYNDGSCIFLDNPAVDMTAQQWDLYFNIVGEFLQDMVTLTLFEDQTGIDTDGFEFNWGMCDNILSLGSEPPTVLGWNGTYFFGQSPFGYNIEMFPTVVAGCTNPDAPNYDASANEDDGSCDMSYLCGEGTYYDEVAATCLPLECPGDFNNDGLIGAGDLLDFLALYNNACE